MKATKDTLLAFLAEHGIAHTVENHAPVLTMAESAMLTLQVRGARCKNLFVQNKKKTELFLILLPADGSVDLAELGRRMGTGRLSFCSVDQLQQHLGVEPGAATPFALVNDRQARAVRLLVDEKLRSETSFLFHPLTNTATVEITAVAFRNFVETVGHKIEFIDVPERVNTDA